MVVSTAVCSWICQPRCAAAVARMRNWSEIRKLLLNNGAEANPSTPEELRQMVRAEVVKWTRAAKTAGLQPQL